MWEDETEEEEEGRSSSLAGLRRVFPIRSTIPGAERGTERDFRAREEAEIEEEEENEESE